MRKPQQVLITLILLAASWQLASAAYIHVKAYVAQKLLLSAWEKTLQGEEKVKPWSWSDTWPIARLQMPAYGEDLIILAGDSGRNLAFGPGYRFGTAQPGTQGMSMVSAHRDTHFRFLKDVILGDEFKITTDKGKTVFYGITDIQIVNRSTAQIDMNKTDKQLVLITCYPFSRVQSDTDLRYLVFAKEISKTI